MRNFEKYFAVTLIMLIVFLANTVSATVHPTAQIGTKTTQNFPADNDFLTNPTPAKSIFDSHSEKVINQKSENFFPNFWEFNNFSKDMIKEIGEFASVDDDSMELVIGVNKVYPDAYNSIVDIVDRFGGKVVNTVSIKGKVIAITADMPLDGVSLFRKEVQTTGLVQYLEPNMKFQAQFVPNDPYWNVQWGPQKIEADYAWNTTTGSHEVLVAVIDTGIDYTHPDLVANYVPLGYDWVNNDDDPIDDMGHGTHCAGIIAAVLNNSVGIAGIANVSIMAEKGLSSEGMGTEDWLANCIIHAVDQGADILSNSWGGLMDSNLIHSAVQYAHDNGVLIIAAAGNTGQDLKSCPAFYDEVVAVTATDQNDNPASFTSYGDWVEVAAPGVDIYSTMPTYPVSANNPPYNMPMNYSYASGTSMACPHVAGLTGLIWSRFPNATRDWVRVQLRYTADDKGDIGFDKYYGYGRVNARKAVEQAPPSHDLLIFDYKKPKYIQPGISASLNITVMNFGANDEQDLTVQLLVNGTLTDSKIINQLANGASNIVSLSWTPLTEGTYNVTFYVVPILGETNVENNVLMKMISVKTVIGSVLFDQTRCSSLAMFSIWEANLTARGYMIDTFTGGLITLNVLVKYDIFVIPMSYTNYSPDEMLAIRDFVLNGGGLLVMGSIVNTALTSFAGINWSEISYDWSGLTNNITSHNVTEEVASVFFGFPQYQLFVSSPAIDLIRDGAGHNQIMLAVSEIGAGRVIALSDVNTIHDGFIGFANNLRLANNMIDWLLGEKYEHELVVSLDTPSDVEPDKSLALNATVYNLGLCNETNVELQLLINDTLVSNVTIPELANGTSYALSYPWTAPDMVATYNLTAYSPPLSSENVTVNNINTKFVSVHYPLINPVEGQFANYILNYYNTSGYLQWTLFWNFTYDQYVAPYKFKLTVLYNDPYGNVYSAPMIVNTMNRFVESGEWFGYWYPGWIETDISVGSTVNLVLSAAKVNGSSVFNRVIDCWDIPFTMYDENHYIHRYDKTSGLLISMTFINPYWQSIELFLVDTNVPIGSGNINVAVAGLTSSKTVIGQGYSVSINVTVENQGVCPETANFTVYANSTVIASQIIWLGIGDSTTFTFSWNTTDFARGNYTITAYITPILNETDATDNTCVRWLIITIPGDVTSFNGLPDGRVDMRDIGVLCSNFGKTPFSPDWDPNIDVSGDETVNMRDIGIACSNFMKT